MKSFSKKTFSESVFKIGTDLIELDRFNNFDFNGRLAANIFTMRELRDCGKKQNKAASLAARFAAKEAVQKCLNKNLRYNLIEIVNEKKGQPKVNLLDPLMKNRYKIQVSLSHNKTMAQAFCLAINLDSRGLNTK